jgi:predicted DNA-binding transcriptional regulator YafY
MGRSSNKARRLLDIEALLLTHPMGMSQSEISRRLGVNRSTINRYLPDLPKHIYIDDLDGGNWKIDRNAYLVNVRFDLNEAMAIHLATRLLATRMDRQNAHAAAALRKLGIALETLAPQISHHLCSSADMIDDPDRRQDVIYLRSLEILTLAWAELRKVQVWHQHDDGTIHTYVLSTYFIEPNAIGQSTYVIGCREPPGALRTLKIERMVRVELLRETYTIPNDFNPKSLLSDAWGIWFTGEEPREVVLLFHQRVAHRVGETRWHRSEQVELQKDGSLLWRAFIAEPQEMMPWIRGWGADVEVIKPVELREKIIKEVHELAQIYDGHNE